ncbi:hypothetical protein J3E69DRAFT_364553 [Trichoderma sp. SZMC 28015]
MAYDLLEMMDQKSRKFKAELEQTIDERGQIYTAFPEIAPRYITSINPPYMAVSASRVMNVNGGSTMEQLEAIWRISIVNDETNDETNGVIDAIDHRIHGDTLTTPPTFTDSSRSRSQSTTAPCLARPSELRRKR